MSVTPNPISHPDHFSFEDAIIYNTLTHEPQSVDDIINDIRVRIVENGFYLHQHIYQYALKCNRKEVMKRLENMSNIVQKDSQGRYYVVF